MPAGGVRVAGDVGVDVVRRRLPGSRVAMSRQHPVGHAVEGRVGLGGARLGDQREIGRQRAVLGVAGFLLVLEGRRQAVGQQAGALENLALLVGRVVVLEGGGQRLDGSLGEARPARLRQIAEVDARHAVAACADLHVDAEAALQLGVVVLAEQAAEGPLLALDVLGGRLRRRRRRPGRCRRPARVRSGGRPSPVLARCVVDIAFPRSSAFGAAEAPALCRPAPIR